MRAPEDNHRHGGVKMALLLGAVALGFYIAFFVSRL